MDRHLKERLVGAAVLVAAAIILIPEMLSGPRDSAPTLSAQTSGESEANGVKTYTIDLAPPSTKAKEPATTSVPTFQETAAASPAPETVQNQPSAPPVQESKPAPPATTSAAVERDQRLLQEFNEHEKTVDKKTAEKSAPVTAPPVKPEPEKVARASEHGAWAVQVASFSVRTTSERIAAELKQKGYPAFVTSFATTGQTMYRVRVGPVEDRSAAEALLKKIKPLHPGAAVVAQ